MVIGDGMLMKFGNEKHAQKLPNGFGTHYFYI